MFHLDYFWELLHPSATRCVVPGLALHAVLQFPHADLPPPAATETVDKLNFIPGQSFGTGSDSLASSDPTRLFVAEIQQVARDRCEEFARMSSVQVKC